MPLNKETKLSTFFFKKVDTTVSHERDRKTETDEDRKPY